MNLGWSGWLDVCSILMASVFLVRYVGINLSLAGTTLSLLLLFHGPAYLYYTRVWGPDTEFFDHLLAAAPGEPVIRNLDLAIAGLFLFLCLGIKFADVCGHTRGSSVRAAIRNWGSTPAMVSPAEAFRLRLWILAVILFALLPFLFIDHQLSNISQYLSVDLSAQDKIDLRRDLGGSSFYPYNVLVATFAPYLAFCAIAARRLARRNWIFLLLAIIPLVSVAKMAMLSKAPLAVFLVQLLVVVVLCKSLVVRATAVVGLTATAMGGFAVMSLIAIPSIDGVKVLANFLFYRTFMIVNEGLVEYFAAIPYVLHFDWGAKMGLLGAMFGSSDELPNYWLVSQVHRGDLTSTTSVMFLGDAWADWAWIGVVLFPFAMGLMMRGLDNWLILRRGRSVATIGAIGIGHYAIFIALTRSLQTVLITGGLLLLPVFVWMISGRARKTVGSGAAAPMAGARVRIAPG